MPDDRTDTNRHLVDRIRRRVLQLSGDTVALGGCLGGSLRPRTDGGTPGASPLTGNTGPEVHVSPDGDDGNDGTADSPLGTLEAARDALRDAPGAGGTVVLHDGTYRRADTFVLEPQDSGTADAPVTYRAAAGASPTISGGRPIEGWSPLDQDVPGLPDEAADEVYVTDLPRTDGEPWEFSTLFDAEGRLTRAHTPHRPHRERDLDATPDEALHHELPAHEDDPLDYATLHDAELFCTPHPAWTVNYLPIDSVDADSRVIHTELPSTYPMHDPHSWGNPDGAFYTVENVFEGLSEPGRWVLDTDAERLYLWPRDGGDGPPEGVVAPRTTELVKLAGDHDSRDWVRHVRFEGLTFTRGDRMRWPEDRTSLLAEWELHDEPNALVRLRGVEECTVADCRFVESGSTGCRLDLHAVDCTVEHSTFTHLGGSGVVLDGFGPGSRDANHHNTIRANHFHDGGELWWHSPAVLLSQSGQTAIVDNHVHDFPYSGIMAIGPRVEAFGDGSKHRQGSTVRWDEIDPKDEFPVELPHHLGVRHSRHVLIAHNDVHDVMQRLGDGNGIYLSGTGEACIVRRNHVHDIPHVGCASAIRMDDDQYHSLAAENVVHDIDGDGLTCKQVNQVENNVIAGCYHTGDTCISVAGATSGAAGAGIRRNVCVQTDREDPAPLVEFTDGLADALVDDNCYWSEADSDHAREVLERLREQGQGTRSIVANPDVLTADGGIAIPDDTPAREVGFRPFHDWGPREPPGPRDRTGT
jgi:hypothetical protein